ncbi:hypothetical protein PQR67_15370 [Paraburkholderia fungorum]|uniref:hypothetical protein n=1 Tax=Paraburkholderia fungorum TaxID=134537 RepID=UPI0038B839EE
MHESAAATVPGTALTFARLSGAVDALSSAIAGFALLAGTRAFTFTALLAWREPVLGGVALVLLALVGWLRWTVSAQSRTPHRAQRLIDDEPRATDRAPRSCYNRSRRATGIVRGQPVRPA